MRRTIVLVAAGLLSSPVNAEPIAAKASETGDRNFDIVLADIVQEAGQLIFRIDVAGQIGATTPVATGQMAGSGVYAYVWPTNLDSSAIGFDSKQGIVALAVTAHPDFDDTPKYDEDGDGNPGNDGKTWHSHWVVLDKDTACGAGLKVKDVAPGQAVKMPATAPGVPLFLDSPDVRPDIGGERLTVTVPTPAGAESLAFDGVAAGLRVNAGMAAPLLCVTDVFKIASGDLSLPGRVTVK